MDRAYHGDVGPYRLCHDVYQQPFGLLHAAFFVGRCGGGHGGTPGGRAAALRLAHRASPSSMGTPTSDPYSVQDPS